NEAAERTCFFTSCRLSSSGSGGGVAMASGRLLDNLVADLEDALRALNRQGRLSEVPQADLDRWREAHRVLEQGLAQVRSMLDSSASPGADSGEASQRPS